MAKDILAEPRIAPGDRLTRLISQTSLSSQDLQTIVQGFPGAAPKTRYPALRAHAALVGRTNWRCGALEALLAWGNPDPPDHNTP